MESFSLKFFKSRNIKFFLIGFVFSLPFFWGANIFQKNLEDFLFWGKISDNPQILAAQIIQEDKLEQLKPIRNWQVDNLEISVQSAISVFLDSQGNEKVLFAKESDKILPVASLTKLMAANVIMGNYDFSQTGEEDKSSSSSFAFANARLIKITKQAVAEEENTGNFGVGEIFSAEQLLYSILMESSNDAVAAFYQVIGEKAFVDLMNLEAKNLGLKNTYFVNPTGLDPDKPEGPINPIRKGNFSNGVNYSTAEDLAKLAIYLLETKPKILEISALPEYNLYLANGLFHHKIKNTNELLGDSASWRTGIIGGKTGWTPQAQGCLILVVKMPQNRGITVNVILGSPDRFGEMKELVDWLNEAYKW